MKQHLCRLHGHSTVGLRLLGCKFIDELFRPVIGHPQGNNQHGTKRRVHIYGWLDLDIQLGASNE